LADFSVVAAAWTLWWFTINGDPILSPRTFQFTVTKTVLDFIIPFPRWLRKLAKKNNCICATIWTSLESLLLT
jgi:hypothetical protein